MKFKASFSFFIKSLLISFGMLVASNQANAELKPGASAPDFTAPAALAGNTYSFALKEALKKGPVVVYFYPKAFTRGCTI